jgi:CheY-like chemotaxis protein
MPGMTGLELLKVLSSRKDKPEIIALSAYDDAATRELAEALGVVAFFPETRGRSGLDRHHRMGDEEEKAVSDGWGNTVQHSESTVNSFHRQNFCEPR